MEPSANDYAGNDDQSGAQSNANANDDDINVDAIDTVVPGSQDKEFVINPGQLLGLDQAVLQSIERCRKYSK